MGSNEWEKQSIKVDVRHFVGVKNTGKESLDASIDVCKKFSKEAGIQGLDQTNLNKMLAQIVAQMFFAHAVKVTLFTSNKTDDATKVFDLGKKLTISGRDAERFFSTKGLNVGFRIAIVVAKLFFCDGDLSNGIWDVIWWEKLEHCEGGSSICVTTNELCNTQIS